MDDVLFTVHRFLGYAVALVILISASVAFGRAKNGQEFTSGLYRATFGLLGVQVLLGLALYGTRQAWEAEPLLAYVHPGLAILAIGLGQALLGRARRTQMAVDAHRLAGRALILSFVLVVGAVGVASVA